MKILFSKHARIRLRERGISKNEIFEGIELPDHAYKKHGKLYFQKSLHRGKIEFMCEKKTDYLKVITAYWL